MSSVRCEVAGCRRKAHARGLCQKHYDEKRKSRTSRRSKAAAGGKAAARKPSGRLKVALEEGDENSKLCRAPGCANAHHARGYCKMHYGQLRRRGNVVELPESEVVETAPLSVDQRLVEIKKRHELLKREIANIHRALESESDIEPEIDDDEGDQ